MRVAELCAGVLEQSDHFVAVALRLLREDGLAGMIFEVDVGSGFEQEPDGAGVLVACGFEEGGLALVVAGVDLGARFEEEFN